MFRELFLFWCIAGILSASNIQKRSASSKKSPPVNVSVAQPHYNIPVRVNFSRTQTLNVHPANAAHSAYKQEPQEAPVGVHTYGGQEATYSINPAVVNTVPIPVEIPEQNNAIVEAYVSDIPSPGYAVPHHNIPVAAHPLDTDVQTVVNQPTIQYVSAPVGYQNAAVQGAQNLVYESVTGHHPSPVYINSKTLQPIHHIQPVPHNHLIQYISAPVSHGIDSVPVNVTPNPVQAEHVTVEAQHTVTAHPQSAAVVTSTPVSTIHNVQADAHRPVIQYIRDPVTQGVTPAPVKSEKTVSIGGKQVTVQAQQTVTANPTSATYVTSTPAPQEHNVHTVAHGPAVQYVTAPLTHPAHLNIVPVAAKQVSIDDLQSVFASPSPYASPSPVVVNQHINHPSPVVLNHHINRPPVQLVRNPVVQTIHHSVPPVPVAPVVVPQPVHHIENVHNPSPVQYVTNIQPNYLQHAVPSNIIKHHKSVIAHPHPHHSNLVPVHPVQTTGNHQLVQYVPVSALNHAHEHGHGLVPSSAAHYRAPFGHYSSSPIVQKPVPVYYSAEEPEGLEYVDVAKHGHIRPVSYGHEASFHHHIPLPVQNHKISHIGFNSKLSSQLFYAKLAAKDKFLADLVAKHARPASYSKAKTYSPSSAVSRVSFNGLGVNYGW